TPAAVIRCFAILTGEYWVPGGGFGVPPYCISSNSIDWPGLRGAWTSQSFRPNEDPLTASLASAERLIWPFIDTHRSTVTGQPPGRRKYPAAPASACVQPRMQACTKFSSCTKFELSVRQPITLSVSLAELSTRRSHCFDSWNPTLSTAVTDPRDTQMPILQA